MQSRTADSSFDLNDVDLTEDVIGTVESLTHRLRNVNMLQVRNLTPFPVRDSFASALTQPSEQPQFTTHGRLTDDLDATLGRKRGRKVSSTSTMTMKTLRSDDGDDASSLVGEDFKGNKGTTSRVSFGEQGTSGSSSNSGLARRQSQISTTSPTVRPHRARTTSMASSASSHAITMSQGPSGSTLSSSPSGTLSSLLPDNSQKGLEKVIGSRLVETFITITVPPSPFTLYNGEVHDASPWQSKISQSLPRSRPTSPSSSNHSRKKSVSASRHKSDLSTSSAASQRSQPVLSSPEHKSSSSLSDQNVAARAESTRSSSPHAKSTAADPRPHVNGSTKNNEPVHTFPAGTSSAPLPRVPDYISSIHRPSTNPSFPLDPSSGREFPEWTDLTAREMTVELWGKVREGWGPVSGKGKEKAIDEEVTPKESNVWEVLEKWDVKLSGLRPLPDHLASHSSQLPFNTLIIKFSPHGDTYYVPPPSSYSASRPSSPSPGYESDPETGVKTVGSAGDLMIPGSTADLERTKTRAQGLGKVGFQNTRVAQLKRHPESARTASWQDLVRLVTLQACILDTKQSLSTVVREIDALVTSDETSSLKREASERESWLNRLREEMQEVQKGSDDLQARIDARTEDIRLRRETLRQAREDLQFDIFNENEVDEELLWEREQLSTLRNRFSPVRTTLISTLASVFPIELLSPPDLLYTILDVPLPIPLTATDPAPPLSLASHKEVNEDTLATALGYAAQLVQLLAAYMGKKLVYPATCIGSKSIIKDGISAMVGPRMFPLYSKGVDTYRFEYGVYLLNKDIEMLMVDRDLRALDMRHTLPNLKNLLLILTDGEGAKLPTARSLNSLPPSPMPTTLAFGSSGNSPSHSAGDATPPASGSATPTASGGENSTLSLMSRPFLALSSFSLLGSRSTSTDRAPKKTGTSTPDGTEVPSELSDGASESSASSPSPQEDDDEDRRTIRGVSLNGHPERKEDANGHLHNGTAEAQAEKNATSGSPRMAAPTILSHVI